MDNFKFVFHIDSLLKLLILIFPCKYSNLGIRSLWLVTIYRNRNTRNFMLARSTTSTSFWASLSFSSMSLDIVGIRTLDKFSSLAKLSVALTSRFLNCKNWLKLASPLLRFWTIRKSSLSSSLRTLGFKSKYLEQFLDRENYPNLSWDLTKPT